MRGLTAGQVCIPTTERGCVKLVNVTRRALIPEVLAKLTWPTFKKKILEKYCNDRALDKIEDDFQNLKKGNLTIADYAKQFMDKLGLVEHLAVDEGSKIKAFLKGLPAEMKTGVRNAQRTTLQGVIEVAQLVEDDLLQEREEKKQQGEKRKWEGPTGPARSSKPFNGRRNIDSRREARWCPKFKSKHFGPCNPKPFSGALECFKCWRKDHMSRDCPSRGVCYECREPGHIKRDCPKLAKGNQGVSSGAMPKREVQPKAPGRAFQMTADEARETADVVSGTFLVNSLPTRVLFDSSANRSFVSTSFCKNFTTPCSLLIDALVVEVDNGEHMVVRECYVGCTLELDGKSCAIDLLPANIGGFDVVVGMDWLAKHDTNIF
ncbi:hypothetical protein L6452_05433 [Arctium lappa]|uniref:Uncharacterized protein n=1 Tax=Arctium lappa TaxID=4217 RepID=A0ACB9EG44_ARCLA|nr:hypothetical protein L6452_05433 [Arctium lappa]